MAKRSVLAWCIDEPKPQIDKFADGEGASLKDGLAASVAMRDEYERPWHKQIHKTTRCSDET